MNARFGRWYECSLCEQDYHGVVKCALGWACWKTYVGRPETDQVRRCAMGELGNGLFAVDHHEEALSVREAELSMLRRIGASKDNMLGTQSNLACTYEMNGRLEEALSLRRDAYSGYVKLYGAEHGSTLLAANNTASTLLKLERYQEAKALLRRTLPVARRVLGENDETTIRMRWIFGHALNLDASATLDDLREAVATLEDTERRARRVLGGAHPITTGIEGDLRQARAALRAHEAS